MVSCCLPITLCRTELSYCFKMNPTDMIHCHVGVDHLPPLWFHRILCFTAPLDVSSEHNWSVFLNSLCKPLSVWYDLTCFLFFVFVFSSSYYLSLSHCSPFTLFHTILVSTPFLLLLLCSLCLKMVSMIKVETQRTFRKPPSLFFFECFLFPSHAVLSLSVCVCV